MAFVDEVAPIAKQNISNKLPRQKTENNCLDLSPGAHEHTHTHTRPSIHMLNCNFTSNGFSFSITCSLAYMTFGVAGAYT